MEKLKLTQFSEGSGCGCKIAPAVLSEIIEKSGSQSFVDSALLVGNESMDDAAVYSLGNGMALVSTVDFFTAIVDDPYDYGCIAAANAISDIYAMGAKPIFANAVLSWPVDKLGADMAARVLEGAKKICSDAGILIAGGHSIAGKEPIFGLSVNGICEEKSIKKNNTAQVGDLLYLTKPLGIGVLATAIKKDKISEEDYQIFLKHTCTLNKIGEQLGKFSDVHAMTDVTGFGLLGHLLEMCKGSDSKAALVWQKIPIISDIQKYIDQYVFPDNTWKNWNACEQDTEGVEGMELVPLCDPQTSGGLLIAIDASFQMEFESLLIEHNIPIHLIGKMVEKGNKIITLIKE